MSEAWCDHCELPMSTCVHGRPPVEPAPAASAVRKKAAPRRKATESAPRARAGVTVRHAAPSLTPPAAFRSPILEILDARGGSCEGEELLTAVHESMADRLLDQDLASVNGEARWRQTARRERAAMTDDGLLEPPRVTGVWELRSS